MSSPGPDVRLAGLTETAGILSASSARTKKYSKLPKKIAMVFDGAAGDFLRDVPVACKPKCAFCCHRMVEGTLPEAIAISEHVQESFSEAELAELKSRIAVYEEAVGRFLKREIIEFRETCPFLKDDLCSIYEARPLGCRSIFSGDAGACERWSKLEGPLPFYKLALEIGAWIQKGVIRGSHQEGFSTGVYDVCGAVGEILERGPAVYEKDGSTAPIERFAIKTGLSEGMITASPGFSALAQKPGFFDLMDSVLKGNRETIGRLAPQMGDPTFQLFTDLGLPSLYESDDELESNWDRVGQALERLENARLDPRPAYEKLVLLNTFPWAYAGKDVRPRLKRLMAKLSRDVVGAAYPHVVAPIEGKRKPGRFRLGYLSERLTNFSGSKWATGWLENQSPDIETFAFSLDPEEDLITARWRRLADHYYQLPIPILQVAEFVRSLDLDALIFTDLSMGRSDSQLTPMRLARRQLTAWGHPVTSGSPTIEGYLSSLLMEPSGAQEHYTEKLYLLPGSGLCYPRVIHPPEDVDPTRLGLPAKGFFFQAQMASKALPKDDEVFRRITEESGKPIAFLSPKDSFNVEKLEKRLRRARVNAVIVPLMAGQQFHGLMAKSDAVLDTPAWNGGNSTVDALTLGKPVISFAGEFMRGRHSLAFLAQAGVSGLIAKDLDDYVSLALDADRQQKAMAGLNIEGLYEDKAPVKALDEILLADFND
jgi:Fe-S-cluster containining protein